LVLRLLTVRAPTQTVNLLPSGQSGSSPDSRIVIKNKTMDSRITSTLQTSGAIVDDMLLGYSNGYVQFKTTVRPYIERGEAALDPGITYWIDAARSFVKQNVHEPAFANLVETSISHVEQIYQGLRLLLAK
jgi:hypothetical protein